MLCRNCLKNELKTRREWFYGVCWSCQAKVNDYIMNKLRIKGERVTLDYAHAFIVNGARYIPFKKKEA